jgi:hypothetical protein
MPGARMPSSAEVAANRLGQAGAQTHLVPAGAWQCSLTAVAVPANNTAIRQLTCPQPPCPRACPRLLPCNTFTLSQFHGVSSVGNPDATMKQHEISTRRA